MKIAIDVSQMCYEGAGVARYLYGLTEALLKLKTGHDFLLFAGTLRQKSYFTKLESQSPWDSAEWKILPLPPKLAGLALNALPIPIESLIGPVDLFHTSDWSEPSSKCPRVTTVHDLVFKKYSQTVDPLILSTQTRRLAKVVASGTHIIADSKSTKNDLMEIYHLKSDQIDVVYPGINSIYSPQKNTEIERVKTKYNLPDRFILSVGTQEPRKNLARLVEASHLLDIPLVLTGKVGWGDKLTTPGVISTGYIPDSDLPALYSGAAVFAYPSLYEGFGFPILEAMACGTPVVTSNVSSLPEIAGKAAVLVDPTDVQSIANGISQALTSSTKLIELGLSQAKQFTWENTAKQTMEVYEKTASRN